MHWSSMELLESNNLLAGWSGFKLRSTPLQSKKITGRKWPTRPSACSPFSLLAGIVGLARPGVFVWTYSSEGDGLLELACSLRPARQKLGLSACPVFGSIPTKVTASASAYSLEIWAYSPCL